jgi:hypothetical protein
MRSCHFNTRSKNVRRLQILARFNGLAWLCAAWWLSFPPRAQSAPSDPQDNDLAYRVAHCRVVAVEGDSFHSTLSVSGVVQALNGRPVAGAAVVLRESSRDRASAEQGKYIADREVVHLVHVNDVFARTITDQSGQFWFHEVKAPAFPARWAAAWKGDVVAAHPDHGVGWFKLPVNDDRNRMDSNLKIILRTGTEILGQYDSPVGDPLPNTVFDIQSLGSASLDAAMDEENQLLLHGSQLAPRASSDEQGRFRFSNVPMGLVAKVSAHRQGTWQPIAAAVATSSLIPIGKEIGSPLNRLVLVGSPFRIVADPGVSVAGNLVDPAGSPVANGRVLHLITSEETRTNAAGQFELRFPTKLLHSGHPLALQFRLMGDPSSDFLSQDIRLTTGELQSGKALQATLQRGVRVEGKVVHLDGTPAPDLLVISLDDDPSKRTTAITDANGEFHLVKPVQRLMVVVAASQPGYVLPSLTDLNKGMARWNDNWPRLEVDLQDAPSRQLPPIAVARTGQLLVTATWPDGKPVPGVDVVVLDAKPLPIQRSAQLPPTAWAYPISEPRTTDANGQALLQLRETPSQGCIVEMRYQDQAEAHYAIPAWRQVRRNRLVASLGAGWKVRGQVTRNRQPAANAQVAVRRTMVTDRVLYHEQRVATDADGWYEAIVGPPGPDDRCSIRCESIEGASPLQRLIVPAHRTDREFRAPTLTIIEGTQEIRGVVLESAGLTSVSGALVALAGFPDMDSVIVHESGREFQMRTDAAGRFSLKGLPMGQLRLQVAKDSSAGRPSNPLEFLVDSGDLQAELLLPSK